MLATGTSPLAALKLSAETRRRMFAMVSVVDAPKGSARVTGFLPADLRGYRVAGSDEAGERLFGV